MSAADDRYFPVHTEDMLKHSKPALDGWEGSGCELDCLERLCKVALQLDVWQLLEEQSAFLTELGVYLHMS